MPSKILSMSKKNNNSNKPSVNEEKIISNTPKKPNITEQNTTPLVDFFENLGNKCQWIALGLLILIGGIVFKDFLFFDKIFLYKDIGSDSLNFSDPLLSHSIRYMHDYGFPTWSFEFGMGQNIFAFTLLDPIDYLLYPLGVNTMRSLLGYKVLFELVLAGFVFYHYLRMLKLKHLTAIMGSLMYAFSGFMIVGSCWFIFSVEVLTMAFILLGFEKLYQKNQFWLFPLPIAYLVISRPFVLATLTIFLILYISLRFFMEEKFNVKNYILTLSKTALAGITGVLIASPWLLEHLQMMLDSPRGSGANSLSGMLKATPMFNLVDKIQFGTAINRMFASEILGSGNDFKGWQNIMEAPNFYVGIPCLLLIPQLFSNISRRLKIVYGSFLGIWILPILFPYFRYAFSFFTGDYYRSFSFYVGLSLMLIALFALDKIVSTKKINLIILFSTLIGLLALLYYPYFEVEDIKVGSISSFVTLMLLVYTGIIYSLPKQTRMAQFALLGVFVLELAYLSSISINNRDLVTSDDLKNKIGYNDYSNEAIAFIKKQDKGFYRIDKRYSSTPAMHGSLNDGMAQGYYGTSSYNSFNQKYYIQYLKAVGIIEGKAEAETRWAEGLRSRMILEGLNSVKYVLSKSPSDPGTLMAFDSIARFGDVTVLKHKFVLPLGFAYDEVLSFSDFQKCSSPQKDFMSLRAAVVSDSNLNEVSNFKKLTLADTLLPASFSFETIKNSVDSLSQNTFQVKGFKPDFIQGSIQTSKKSILYLSIPFDKNWRIRDSKNKEYNKILLTNGMTGIILDAGNHELELKFSSSNLALGKKISYAGIALMALLIFLTIKFKKTDE